MNNSRLKFDFLNIVILGFTVFFASWYFVYKVGLNPLAIQSEDTLPAIFIPVTLIKEGTIYADTYYKEILKKYPHPDDKKFEKGSTPFYFKKVIEKQDYNITSLTQFMNSLGITNITNKVEYPVVEAPDNSLQVQKLTDHYVSAFPIIAGLLALPVYFVPLSMGLPITWDNLILWSHIASSLLVAISGGFFYLLLRNGFEVPDNESKLLTYTYLFGTVNFALVSQSLWQHGALQLFVILSLYYFQKVYKDQSQLYSLFLSSVFLGIAILARPTAALLLPFLFILIVEKLHGLNFDHFSRVRITTLYYLIKGLIKPLLIFLLGLIPAVVFFLFYNFVYYFDINNQGYAGQVTENWLSRFPEGFLGLWVSPSKGILVFSPVFVFSILSIFFVHKGGGIRKNFNFFVFFCIVIVHTLIIGMWKHWYGGYSFGYRMAADIIPFLVLLLVPLIRYLKFPSIKPIFVVLVIVSVAIQIYGMIFFDGIWHNAYDKGYKDTSWLWSISDSEFVFNMRRVLVKLEILEKACPQCLPSKNDLFPILR